ncbi:MAG: acetyl-CoA C-acetyltransferase [Candidatus Thermoplasmatota archaeon]|nr:acetyl-CoA C-acetyltransferase [Candidatus Thermoplasmatota archaeon]MDI6887075.1 acetyl-CoA C-acetyltransferase [Candidatus Thermoplasmatota archaeon]
MEVVITSAVRTAVGKFEGSLRDFPAPQLGSLVIKEALKRSNLSPEQVNEVIMGLVVSAGLGQNPARQASLGAGIPKNVGAFTINKVCGSGLKAVMLAAQAIKVGDAKIVVAGGMENMTRGPYLLDKARSGYRLGDGKIIDAMVLDGLWDIYNNFHMGITGERIAERFKLTRDEIDRFALRSHQLAAKATKEGKFKSEILPIEIPQKKGPAIVFDKDEGIREDTSIEALSKLKPVFKPDGMITAGNASQISDGASALVVMSSEEANALGLKPLVKIVDYHTSGVEPENVMEAPIPTVKELLAKTGFAIEDIDLIEHNEAFASASVVIQREFEIPDDKFNVHGGAVALGHPIGASGARVLTTLIYALKDRNKKRGLATLCLGGGNAVAMIVERL